MEAGSRSFNFTLTPGKYFHLAAANLEGNGSITLVDREFCGDARFAANSETVAPQRSTLLSGRQSLEAFADKDSEFEVPLYPVGSAIALVADTLGSGISSLEAFGKGLSDGFLPRDSVYTFSSSRVFAMYNLPLDTPGQICLASVVMPSAVLPRSGGEESPLWAFEARVGLPGGSVTRSELGIAEPLLPGQIRIVKVKIDEKGVLRPADARVGLSVTLDWKPGMTEEIEF